MGLFKDAPAENRTCLQHGEYAAKMTPAGWTECPECFWEAQRAEDKQRREEIAKAQEQQRIERVLGRAAIPDRFKGRTLDTYVPQSDSAKHALNMAKSYADNFKAMLSDGASLIFCGGVGTGKTHLAVGIALQIIGAGHTAVFSSVMGAVRSVKETYRRDSELTESDAIDNLVYPDLLILDEVGVQFGSDTEKLILFEIINGRYERVKPTIVISNLAREALTDFLGERVVDRLREGGGRLVVFDWPSYRRQA